ncbi:uba3 [Symbiodinium necroappetens]|uniref:NEDD8-activating enzyme E1 catalytic subunit n=1 Tax=Symbiodinium necroappetens TaxID=1628268 RepID=A0A812YIL2_9DINO|nr:uba3 [Symbiodinium necroappetens]
MPEVGSQLHGHVFRVLSRKSPFADPDAFEPGAETISYLRESCKVLVIGAGGLGCEILKDLALSGFPDIHVIDMDTIDVTNLNRQFLFRQADVGKPKAEVAAAFINRRLGHIGTKVTPHVGKIQDFDETFYRKFNLLIAGLDNIAARRWMNATLHDMIDRTSGEPDPSTIIPLIDGGTEGFKGQARVIIPSMTSCFDCSLDAFPPQVNYPLCTIAETPRLPEHCIEYALVVMWEQRFPGQKMNADSVADMQWIYETAKDRAETFGIQGVTYQLTMGVVKRIIPAIASTNALISAALVAEALKVSTYCGPVLNNYMMYMGQTGVYTHTFPYEKKDDCMVCGGATLTLTRPRTSTLQELLDHLGASPSYQLSRPSVSSTSGIVFMQNPKPIRQQHEYKLKMTLEELTKADPPTPRFSTVFIACTCQGVPFWRLMWQKSLADRNECPNDAQLEKSSCYRIKLVVSGGHFLLQPSTLMPWSAFLFKQRGELPAVGRRKSHKEERLERLSSPSEEAEEHEDFKVYSSYFADRTHPPTASGEEIKLQTLAGEQEGGSKPRLAGRQVVGEGQTTVEKCDPLTDPGTSQQSVHPVVLESVSDHCRIATVTALSQKEGPQDRKKQKKKEKKNADFSSGLFGADEKDLSLFGEAKAFEEEHSPLLEEQIPAASSEAPLPPGSTEKESSEGFSKNEADASPIEVSFYAGRAKSALQAADANLPWRRGRLVLLGQGRAGKSSTVRSLVGKPFDDAQVSTIGVETASCEIQRGDAVGWHMKGTTSETESLVKQLLADGKDAARKHGPEVPEAAGPAGHSPSSSPVAEVGAADDQGSGAAETPAPQDNLLNKLPVEEVAQKLDQEMIMLRKSVGQPVTFSTWDFGGQSVFHNLHHLFLSRCSVYLVVFKMPHMLRSDESCERAIAMLRYWLNSLAMHARGAPVLLVGTHKDDVPQSSDHRKISKILWEKLENRLVEQVHPFTREEDEGLWYFPIDNTRSGHGADPVVQELQHAIESAAHEDTANYLEKPIPIRWRGVLDVLVAKNESIITMEELGVLFHFQSPMELREIVILQPQWLVSGICQVIFDWTLHEQEHHKQIKLEMKSAYDAWRYKGVVSKRLLDRLWEHGYEQPAHKSFLLRFMEQVALACEVGPDTFLVPSLLPHGDATGSKCGVAHRHFWLDFAPSFLPDNLFKRLICYAVQKCSQNTEPVLHESFAHMTFEGHDFGIEAHLDHDLIKVDIFSAAEAGAWLILHSVINLVEHLRLDFMKDLKYEVWLSGIDKSTRAKKAEVEQEFDPFFSVGSPRDVSSSGTLPKGAIVLQLIPASVEQADMTQPPTVLVDSQWRQLKSAWPFLARHERKFGPSERTALYKYLRDPAQWGISWSALESIEQDAKNQFGSDYISKSMWHVVQQIVKPSCAEHGAPIALVRNGSCSVGLPSPVPKMSPDRLPVQDFITHCWREPFHEFMDSLRHAYDVRVVKPHLFICAFSLFQGVPEDIQEALGQSISQAPFVKALAASERYVVVRNRMEDLYTRAWCLVEYIYAKKFGFYKDKVLVTGPNEFSESRTTCTQIKASDEEDRLKIFKFIMDEGGPAVIDPQIHEFRAFDARFGGLRSHPV